MRLGLMMGYSGADVSIDIEFIREAERLGYDSVWSAEAWGSDAVTPLAWVGALTTQDQAGHGDHAAPRPLAGEHRDDGDDARQALQGRFILGLGTSGPQVVEGWHGVPFDKPLTWMREYVTIVRDVFAREKPLEFSGARYQIPYRGPGATGLGQALEEHPPRPEGHPHLHGSMAPKSQAHGRRDRRRLLLTCMHPERFDVIAAQPRRGLRQGRRRARASPISTSRPPSRSSSATISTPAACRSR